MLTIDRKRELLRQLEGIAGNGGPEGALAQIMRELLEHMPPGGHAESVDREMRKPR
jgi:hypothetical protein